MLQGLECLTLLSLDLLILCNELFMPSFPSFPFIVLFLQVFWSKFASFSRRKPTTSQLNLQFCFYPQCHFQLASYVFMSLQIFPLIFFLISWAFFFSFSTSDCLFWVSASVLCSLSSNLSVRSSRSCYLWLLVLFLTCTFSWR